MCAEPQGHTCPEARRHFPEICHWTLASGERGQRHRSGVRGQTPEAVTHRVPGQALLRTLRTPRESGPSSIWPTRLAAGMDVTQADLAAVSRHEDVCAPH